MDWSPIQQHYERTLREHGPNHKGVDWPRPEDLEARFATQLEVLAAAANVTRPVLLDLGCGPGLLLDFLRATDRLGAVEYRGVDISAAMVEAANERWPGYAFEERDILKDPLADRSVDVVIANGVLTERVGIERADMVAMAEALVTAAFRAARVGIAFNVMSKHVEWERDDLFHWGFDEVAAFVTRDVSRHVRIRADYGLYEYTFFVWREAQAPTSLGVFA